ncbi:transcription antitermination factor NusB [Candidatus Roizmanbacteria bacterium RIFCSPHIGHO2_01_FULL_39_12b]|uniref:Transcription antitermination factor NusB n=1 Tax=Candidatus Roizmanbacteria bacterium RIFCSPHIGHO2_01_FULL_39_12b TaxID=1802030 RepID=A0A1F7GD75_9BACT|nr:MAG: transcription antitermination factor NusB [Candidatus Roizmanbacteria bacterium RIFCSPHIGHO2_01_FULL_39_12b]
MKTIQELYAFFFANSKRKSRNTLVGSIVSKSPELDGYINEFAKQHGADELSKIDLSILRLAVYEMLIENKTPPKVVINEAVELAKEFGGNKSPAFVNAILGGLYQKHKQHNDK